MFLIAMLMIDHFMNKGNTDITAEMPKATYPLVYVMEGDTRINCLHGYDQEMDCSQLDDTISPLQKDDRKISLQIDLYADSISSLAYEVRSADGQRLVEDTEAGSFTESEDMAYVDLVLKDLLEENTEYSFCLKLTDTEGRTIYYYTRIVLADAAYHVSDMTAFALDFHSRSFDKDRAQELTKYLESNADGDNTTYSKVTIHSSFAQITWGDLSVKEETEPEVYVRRINPYVANVELRYALSVDMADGCRYYNVTEYYYIRYTAERMYLLDYERDMDSYFEPEAASYTNNKLSLGISDGNLELAESEDGNVFAFVKENRLFSINLTDSKTALLFGFYDQNNVDSRTLYQDGGIRIASVDETGNVRFLVYGYMNRGNHEGSVGVGCYYYNSMLNTIEEEVYIPYTGSSQRLMQDISQLAYVNNKNQLFLILDHVIYQIDLVGKNYTALQENLIQGSYRVSESNRMIAWLTGDVDNSQELILLNLNTGRQTKIEAGSGRCIRPLGFMNEDLIYGLAYRTDITKDTMGNTLFLMYDVKIQNESGDILKDYNKSGIYVLEAKSEPGVTMTPLQKFLDSSATIEGRPAAAIARITLPERRELATRAIGEAKKYLGQPYDDSFLPHNGKMYCSELVWECYLTGSKNEHLFTARPMNFRTADGRLPQFWIDHFAAMDQPIPEGVPGTNPQDMSREKFLKIVYRYWQ